MRVCNSYSCFLACCLAIPLFTLGYPKSGLVCRSHPKLVVADMQTWDLSGWEKRPVTFFEALGFNSAKIKWPQLQPTMAQSVAQSSANTGAKGGSGGSVRSTGGAVGGTDAQNQALGKQMAARPPYNWTGAQWIALNNIVMAESGWNVHADNSSSGAYGIPQSLPGTKMASAGPNWQNSAQTQIAWMLQYIQQRYGNPIRAWQFHLANGWY